MRFSISDLLCRGVVWAMLAMLVGCSSTADQDDGRPGPSGGTGGAGGSAGGAPSSGGAGWAGGAGGSGGAPWSPGLLCANALPMDMGELAVMRAVAGDHGDGVVVAGMLEGSFETLGIETAPEQGREAFVARFDEGCQPTYVKTWGGTDLDAAQDVVVDPLGNAVIVGQFRGPASFDAVTLQGGSNSAAFIAKLAPDGELLWARGFSGDGNEGRHVAVGDDGSIVLWGTLKGTLDAGAETVDSLGYSDLFLARLDSSGNVQWIEVLGGGSGWERAEDVAIGPGGVIAVAGGFQDTLSIGTTNLVAKEQQDAFVALFDPSGELLWARAIGAEPYIDEWQRATENMRAVGFAPDGEIVGLLKYGREVDLGGAGLLKTALYRANARVVLHPATGVTLSATVLDSPDSEHLRVSGVESAPAMVSARFVLDPFQTLEPYVPAWGGRTLAIARHGVDAQVVSELRYPLGGFVGTPNAWLGAGPWARVAGLATNADEDIFVAVNDMPSVGVAEPFLQGRHSGVFFAWLRP